MVLGAEDGGCDALLTLRFTEQVREGESGLDELFEATFLNYLVDGDKRPLPVATLEGVFKAEENTSRRWLFTVTKIVEVRSGSGAIVIPRKAVP